MIVFNFQQLNISKVKREAFRFQSNAVRVAREKHKRILVVRQFHRRCRSVFSSAHLQCKLLLSLANSPIYQRNQCFLKCAPHPRHARHRFQVVVDEMRRSSGRRCQKKARHRHVSAHQVSTPHRAHGCERPARRPQHNYWIKKGRDEMRGRARAATMGGCW